MKILFTFIFLLCQALAWGQKATLVKDIWPGTNDSEIWDLISVGNKVIFKANNGINKGVNEDKLWISDGTENGTVKLSDIPLGEYPDFLKFNNIITYNATDPQRKVKLFRTDGTEKGTFQIWDRDYSYLTRAINLLSVDNKAYWIVIDSLDRSGKFIQKDLNNFEATTILDKNLSNDIVSFRPPKNDEAGSNFVTPFGNKWLFYGYTNLGFNICNLYISDGTKSGTQKLPIPGNRSKYLLTATTPTGLNAFFSDGGTLWKTDGTSVGTQKVKDIEYDKYDFDIGGRPIKGGIIFWNTSGTELWFSDGTANGTKIVKTFPKSDSGKWFLTIPDIDRPFFYDQSSKEIWRTDGTSSGTKIITKLSTSSSILSPGFIRDNLTDGILKEGNSIYVLDRVGNFVDIIKIDLTTDIPTKVGVISNSTLINSFAVAGGHIFYEGHSLSHGQELWKVSLSPCSHTVKINTPNGTSFCSGSSVKINAESTGSLGPFTYSWRTEGRVHTTDAILTTGEAGTYTVDVKDKEGCIVSASVEITQTTKFNLPVNITGNNVVCTGQITTLTANATGGVSPYTYQWKQNSVNVGTNAITYAASAAGSYNVAVTDSKGCTGTSAAYSVTQKPSPNVTVSSSRTPTLLTGESVVLSVPTAAGQTYQWAKDGVAIAGATNNSYTVSGAGSYTVAVTGSGCTATSSAVMVSIILANEPLAEEIGLRVSPNPAINQAKIVLQLAQSASANVYVLDASGRRVRTWESGGKATRHEVMLDMRSVAAGKYVVQAEAEGQVFTEKLVKQ